VSKRVLLNICKKCGLDNKLSIKSFNLLVYQRNPPLYNNLHQ